MEDSGYTLPEFYTLLSNVTSSSHPTSRKRNTTLVTNNNVEWVSMNDFTEVLQTDLLFPLTKQDQLVSATTTICYCNDIDSLCCFIDFVARIWPRTITIT